MSPSPPLQPQTLANRDFTCFGCPPELIAEGEGKTFHVLVFPWKRFDYILSKLLTEDQSSDEHAPEK